MNLASLARITIASLAIVSAAHAESPAAPIGKLNRIADSALARSMRSVASADVQIDKAVAKGSTSKAMLAAARARTQLESIADKAHLALDKAQDAFEAKYAEAENSAQLLLAVNFTVARVDALIDQHLNQCLEDVDQSLIDAGLTP